MKHLIYVLFVLLLCSIGNAQDMTLLHINAKWNQSNNYDLKGIKNCKIKMALLEDLVPSMKAQIKSVPTIILLDKYGKPRGQWKAGLSFKVEMEEKDAKESYDLAQKAHSMSKEQMKMMLERETGPSDRFSSSFG